LDDQKTNNEPLTCFAIAWLDGRAIGDELSHPENQKIKFKNMNRNHPAFKKEAEPFHNIIMEGLTGEEMKSIFGTLLPKMLFSNFYIIFQGLQTKSKVGQHIWIGSEVIAIFFIQQIILEFINQ
jgi:hypothetical protein